MQKLKTYALSAAALSGLFLIGSVVRSRDSQARAATYSTPVTVMNTTANAAGVRDEDSPGRNAFQAQFDLSLPGSPVAPVLIPPGKRLVIDYVAVDAVLNTAGTQPYVFINTSLGTDPLIAHFLTLIQSSAIPQRFYDHERVQLYGDTASVRLSFTGFDPSTYTAHITISGHLIDMP